MQSSKKLTCPNCNGNQFLMKYEASYVYSYVIDSDSPGLKNKDEFLPFLFDKREQKYIDQYIECNICHTKYPCYFNQLGEGINTEALKKVIRSSDKTR